METNSNSHSRRHFIKNVAALGAGVVATSANQAVAAPANILSEDRKGVLVDTTVCIGCRNCEWACKKSHDKESGNIEEYSDRSVFKQFRRPSAATYTVVNEFSNPKNPALPINVKVQCMHCDRPACVSACIVGALSKYEDGSTIWDPVKCIGCRYCMVACSFQIPTFDYNKAIEPNINKCDFCNERRKAGKLPACVDICPVEALVFGTRSEIIKIAREKIQRNPERYINHIYGENEVSGTSWVYLAGRNFYELGFPKLGFKHAPGVSEAIQHGIFAYFVPPVMFYSLLGTMMWIYKRREEFNKEAELAEELELQSEPESEVEEL
ncbi:MAG: 4Fe-4S ferredoxin iron-sulfur binding domain protein [Ignavibacteria bacterium]|nr:4Fe-4S ferredoxin iron-sulfur binding domain protein [Ignavibacteria bacterium]